MAEVARWEQARVRRSEEPGNRLCDGRPAKTGVKQIGTKWACSEMLAQAERKQVETSQKQVGNKHGCVILLGQATHFATSGQNEIKWKHIGNKSETSAKANSVRPGQTKYVGGSAAPP